MKKIILLIALILVLLLASGCIQEVTPDTTGNGVMADELLEETGPQEGEGFDEKMMDEMNDRMEEDDLETEENMGERGLE